MPGGEIAAFPILGHGGRSRKSWHVNRCDAGGRKASVAIKIKSTVRAKMDTVTNRALKRAYTPWTKASDGM